MLRFDNIIVFIKRPVTSVTIAEVLEIQSFEVMGALIPLEIFLSPEEQLSDAELKSLGHSIGVDFRINEGGGSSTTEVSPTEPDNPSTLGDGSDLPKA